MKKFIILVLMFCLIGCAAATDFQTVSDKSVTTFLQVYPQYKALLEKYGQEPAVGQALPRGMQYTKEIESLLSKFGLSIQSFAVLMQKISAGFASARLENSPVSGMFGSVAKQMGTSLTPEETAVIKKYLPQIEKILSGE